MGNSPFENALRAFTITITDARMYYETKGVTFGVVDLRLGKDTFAKAMPAADAELAIGARHTTYVRHYESSNPSGFQEYWLVYNVVGAGFISGAAHASGIYAAKYAANAKYPDGTVSPAPIPRKITANTLTVLSPEGGLDHAAHINKLVAHGPHIEHLRLLWTERARVYK